MPPDQISDRRDFGRLFVQAEPRVYGYICSLVMNRADADDLLQETASVLWRKFDEFDPETNFLAWSMAVARLQVMYYRQRQRREMLRFSDQFVEAVAAETASLEELSEMREALSDCISRLKPRDRELFRERYQPGATARTVAETQRRPLSTIQNALSRVRRILHDCVYRKIAKEPRP